MAKIKIKHLFVCRDRKLTRDAAARRRIEWCALNMKRTPDKPTSEFFKIPQASIETIRSKLALKEFERIREYTKRHVQYAIQWATRRRRSLESSTQTHSVPCGPMPPLITLYTPPSQPGSLTNIGSGRKERRRRELHKLNI
jgi:hypothetical protein